MLEEHTGRLLVAEFVSALQECSSQVKMTVAENIS